MKENSSSGKNLDNTFNCVFLEGHTDRSENSHCFMVCDFLIGLCREGLRMFKALGRRRFEKNVDWSLQRGTEYDDT